MTIDASKMVTIRRRITDKLCKDGEFLNSVASLAIEEGAIKHSDILDFKEIHVLLGAPMTQ